MNPSLEILFLPQPRLQRVRRLVVAALAVALIAVGCGAAGGDMDLSASGESAEPTAEVGPAADPTPEITDPASTEAGQDVGDDADDAVVPDPGTPIPVEPDGGIGDGAGPPPGFDDDAPPAEDWHGAQTAETNCPGVTFQRVEASTFSFSVPVDFVDEDMQGIDSEVGSWLGDGIDVLYDYGWYSNPLDSFAGAEITEVDYSGFIGRFVVVRDNGANGRNMVGLHVPEVVVEEDEGDFVIADRLTLVVQHDRPDDEIIGRCIVSSVEWKVPPPG